MSEKFLNLSGLSTFLTKLQAKFALKTHTHTVPLNSSTGVSGILPISNGGTGNNTGLAPAAYRDNEGNIISYTYQKKIHERIFSISHTNANEVYMDPFTNNVSSITNSTDIPAFTWRDYKKNISDGETSEDFIFVELKLRKTYSVLFDSINGISYCSDCIQILNLFRELSAKLKHYMPGNPFDIFYDVDDSDIELYSVLVDNIDVSNSHSCACAPKAFPAHYWGDVYAIELRPGVMWMDSSENPFLYDLTITLRLKNENI